MTQGPFSGGCQCGAVRFRVERLGNGSICHCRMCQKAFAGFFGPLVTSYGLTWTRGEPRYFQSSNRVRRGFCADCGTQLTYEYGAEPEVAIGAFDNPEVAGPVIQVNPADKLSFFDGLASLPTRRPDEQLEHETFKTTIVSYQHPDHDSAVWPPERRP